MCHFIVGRDETCMMGSDGNTCTTRSSDRKKHEKKLLDLRASITMCRVGNANGNTGPTIWLLKGQKKRKKFSNGHLIKNGAAHGSAMLMTETVFMTEEAWAKITPDAIARLRNISDIVKANLRWWMLELLDGFGPHTSTLEAMKLRYDSEMLCVIEEGDSSHANQEHDKCAAKNDEFNNRECLSMLHGAIEVVKGVADQHGLVHSCLHSLWALKPEVWTNSFDACDLDPRTRVDFSKWTKRIEPSLLEEMQFKVEKDNDSHPLLPPFWLRMTAEDRENAMQTTNNHEGEFNVKCLQQLMKD